MPYDTSKATSPDDIAPDYRGFSRGDIVQITEDGHDWFGCLLTLTEATPRRLMGFCDIPMQGQAHLFLRPSQVAKVGRSYLELA